MIFGFGQVEKYMEMAKERIELAKALVRASDRAANPTTKAKAKASAKEEASPPAIAA